MNFLPQASAIRPRVACEITAQGVVAGRSAEAGAPLSAVARKTFAVGAVTPSLKPGNVADRVATAAAVKHVLEGVGLKPNSRGADVTVVIPDSAVRVLLLDFDSLPNKLTEALPIVRFRLKKLLPFDADDAMITFQVMSSSKQIVRVLAVAVPRDVLSEYETVVREAGFEPGVVLPSTLAALAAIKEESPTLLVNANELGVTTAIVRAGILLLHRSVDLAPAPVGVPAAVPAALLEPSALEVELPRALALVDVHDSAEEWSAQQPLPEHGRNPYAESPYAAPTVAADLNSELHNTILTAPTSIGTLTEDASGRDVPPVLYTPAPMVLHEHPGVTPIDIELSQAVNVAAAYFEDTLAESPSKILSAGPLTADRLTRVLRESGVAEQDGLRVRETIEAEDLLSEAVTANVPRAWLAGIVGALRG